MSYCSLVILHEEDKNLSPRDPPPPYRSPPPPQGVRNSPSRSRPRSHMSPVNEPDEERNPEAVSYNTQYKELVSLVNYQREKLSSQQVDLIKVFIFQLHSLISNN